MTICLSENNLSIQTICLASSVKNAIYCLYAFFVFYYCYSIPLFVHLFPEIIFYLLHKEKRPVTSTRYLGDETQQRNTASYGCFPLRWSFSSFKMTESDSNSDCSYDSDDSEYSFIPGHVNIDDIEVVVEQVEPDPEKK